MWTEAGWGSVSLAMFQLQLLESSRVWLDQQPAPPQRTTYSHPHLSLFVIQIVKLPMVELKEQGVAEAFTCGGRRRESNHLGTLTVPSSCFDEESSLQRLVVYQVNQDWLVHLLVSNMLCADTNYVLMGWLEPRYVWDQLCVYWYGG